MHPLLARVYAGRGLTPDDIAHTRLAHLASPASLGGVERACQLLAAAIETRQRICIVGDFDADGATGTAVAMRGLRLLGARNIGYRVPNRFRDGYGLSQGLVESLVADDRPDLIVTVDNGVASHAGVAAARAFGIKVVITDHHLPGELLPDADAIVNPNVTATEKCAHGAERDGALPGVESPDRQEHPSRSSLCAQCADDARLNQTFPSKSLAGVGVMFYLLLALRARLRDAGAFARAGAAEPDLSVLLDLVALGTVADLVPLDANNRILVDAGLRRIRAGRSCAGIAALYRVGKRDPTRAVASDLGFVLGPRINAAGRLDDMALGIECLLADDVAHADRLAAELSAINAQRQEMQAAMVEQGEAMVADFLARHRDDELPYGIVLHESDWHPGIVGLVASKLKERLHRPVIAFAPANAGMASHENADRNRQEPQESVQDIELRGSARSIAGFHLRDALAEVDASCPGLIKRFGGHAMAAGLTLSVAHLARFAAEFDVVARRRLDTESLENILWSDGSLAAAEFCAEVAHALRYAGPWGQAFAEPVFDNVFVVESWRMVGERHLKLVLRAEECPDLLDAILFNALDSPPPPPKTRLRAAFQLDVNHWNGQERLQLLLRHMEAV